MKVQRPHGLIVWAIGNGIPQLVKAVRMKDALDADPQNLVPRVKAKPDPPYRPMGGRARNVHSGFATGLGGPSARCGERGGGLNHGGRSSCRHRRAATAANASANANASIRPQRRAGGRPGGGDSGAALAKENARGIPWRNARSARSRPGASHDVDGRRGPARGHGARGAGGSVSARRAPRAARPALLAGRC
jgi:hypothetical protein